MLKKAILTLLALLLIAAAAPSLGAIGGNQTAELEPDIVGQINQTDVVVTPTEESLWLQMRTLWEENVFWTREAIFAIAQGSEDKGPVLDRLSRNSADMAETLSLYLGNETARKYGDMVGEDLKLAAEYIDASASGNATAQEDASSRWRQNADEIAAFENTTIPSLLLENRRAMWNERLNLTMNETSELLNKDYNASIDTFDLIEEHAQIMADSLTDGVIQQSPKMFH